MLISSESGGEVQHISEVDFGIFSLRKRVEMQQMTEFNVFPTDRMQAEYHKPFGQHCRTVNGLYPIR